MLRPEKTFTYTEPVGTIEGNIIDRLLMLVRQQETNEAEKIEIETLSALLPTVHQERITVAQCNGLASAKYQALVREATDFFTEQTGLPLPLPKVNDKPIELNTEQNNILNYAFKAAASLAATTKFEVREAKVVVDVDGVQFDDANEWKAVKIPVEYNSIANWVDNCPAVLQDKWSYEAYETNGDLWRRRDDDITKNFAAVSGS